jgi:hypothetical protein
MTPSAVSTIGLAAAGQAFGMAPGTVPEQYNEPAREHNQLVGTNNRPPTHSKNLSQKQE